MVHEWAQSIDAAGFWSRFALGSLVTWRLTHLIAYEDGPWDLIARLRAAAGPGFFGKLMDCFYCLSIWMAAAVAPLVLTFAGPMEFAMVWIGLSGSACLLERATAPR